MKTISEYTVLELLERYKDIIGEDVENFLYDVVYDGIPTEELKEAIDIKTMMKNDKKARTKAAYSVLEGLFANANEDIENINFKKTLLARIIERYPNKIKARTKKEMKELILEGKSAEVYKYPSKKYKGVDEYKIVTDEEPKSTESIYDSYERRLFEQAIDEVSINDLESIIKPKYGKSLMEVIIKEVSTIYFLEEKKITPKEYFDLCRQNRKEDDPDKIVLECNQENVGRDVNQILRDYLKTNFHYVNQEALLLNAAAKLMLGIRLLQGEKICNVRIREVAKSEEVEQIHASIMSLERISRELKKNKYSRDIIHSIKAEDGQEIITTDKQNIDDFLEKCTDTKYLSDEYIEKLHEGLSEGIMPEDIEELRIAGVDVSDVINVMDNYEENQRKKEKEHLLETAKELTNYLKQNGKIDSEHIIKLYMDGNVSLNLLGEVDISDLSKEYFEDKLLEVFGENVFINNEETNNRIKKYGNLYSMLREKGQIDTTTDQIVEKLSEVFGEEFIPGIIDDLYKMKIANMQDGLQWLGGEFLTELYKQENLRPVEIRRLYNEGTINFEDLTSMVKLLNDNTEQFMVISSLFPEAESIETRQELFKECLDLGDSLKEDDKGTKRKKGEKIESEYNQYITDPGERFKVVQLLDKEYSLKMTSDGHAIMHLPSRGKVFIEKMLDKDGNPYYGAATYIVDKEYFEKNEDMIVIEDKIKRSKLSQNSESKSIERVIHSPTGWGKGIKRIFEINEETRTPEELQEIEDAIKSVEESRRKIERE